MVDMLLGLVRGQTSRGGLIRAGHFILNPPCRQQATTAWSRRALFNSWRSCRRGPGVRLLHSQAPWGSSVAFPCWPWPQRHVSDYHPAPDASCSGNLLTADSPRDSMGTIIDSGCVHGPDNGNHIRHMDRPAGVYERHMDLRCRASIGCPYKGCYRVHRLHSMCTLLRERPRDAELRSLTRPVHSNVPPQTQPPKGGVACPSEAQ